MEAGKRFLHFLVLRQLGKGGMGEVYLAEDQKLGRKVALKFLPQEFTQNDERLRRFELEARAASALNHPNIMTVFEVGEAEGHHFIASEFIQGETLRDKITTYRQLPAHQAVEIGIQISAALAAAHAAKIVHRDIKPENIMIRDDGYVKVLDFGLSKQHAPSDTIQQASVFPTRTFAQTEPGTVLGTVQYMSPEQARGLDLDSRTDLFSLGVVLYEMISGRIPFEGATRSDVLVSILNKEPLQLAAYIPDVRPELQWIVSKALRKDCEERYQTAKEMMGDLKSLQQNANFTTFPSASSADIRSSSPASVTATTSSAEYVVGQMKRHKIAAAIFVVGAIVAAVFLWNRLRIAQPAPAPAEAIKISRLTTSGAVRIAAISPNGKLVAYSIRNSGQESLWIKQVLTGSNIAIIPPADVHYHGMSFSADGDYIFFIRSETASELNSLFKVPVLGGSTSKVLDHIDSIPAISPDGKHLAFVRWEQGRIGKLMTAAVDGSSIKMQIEKRPPDFFRDKIAWSPDGKQIAFVSGGTGEHFLSLFVTVVDSGKQSLISNHDWGDIDGIVWRSNGQELLASAADLSTNWFYQIWSISIPAGVARRITNDANNYVGLSASADVKSLVTIQNDRFSDIWVLSANSNGSSKQVTRERYDGWYGISWTPSGKILFGDRNFDLWLMDADGNNRQMLTPDQHNNRNPFVTSDGKNVLFLSWRKSSSNQGPALWSMTLEGTNPKWLAANRTFANPSCAGECAWIFFDGAASGEGIWKVPNAGGNAVQVIHDDTYSPAVSPDGTKIACFLIDRSVAQLPVIAIYPSEGGSPLKTFAPGANLNDKLLRWTPDGNGIVYSNTENEVSNLWIQPLDGSKPKQITSFDSDYILAFDWSKDGQIAVARGRPQNDVMLIVAAE